MSDLRTAAPPARKPLTDIEIEQKPEVVSTRDLDEIPPSAEIIVRAAAEIGRGM
jgi:hypothetical protein